MQYLLPRVFRQLWRDLSLPLKGVVATGVPLVILFAGFLWFLTSTAAERHARQTLGNALAIRSGLGALVRDLLAMESLARAHALAPNTDLLEQHRAAVAQVSKDYNRLIRALVRDPSLQREWVPKLREKVDEKVRRTAALVAAGSAAESPATMQPLVLASVNAMEKVQEIGQKIDRAEQKKQDASLSALDRADRQTELAGGVTIVATLFGTIVATLLLTGSIRRRIQDLQVSLRALKTEAPLRDTQFEHDEIGELRSELEEVSEILATRTRDLRASKDQMKAIIDSTSAIVYVKDLESRFLLLNNAYERHFGIRATDAIGRSPVELFGQELGSQLRANDLEVFNSRERRQFEETMEAAGKRFRYLSVKAPLIDSSGQVYGLCGISTDVTQKESFHSDKEQPAAVTMSEPSTMAPRVPAEQVHMLEQVTRGVAHDFNNLFATIIGNAMLLQEQVGAMERNGNPASKILAVAQRAAGLCRELLALGSNESSQKTILSLDRIIADLAANVRARLVPSCVLELGPIPSGAKVRVNREVLHQVLANLCLNASEAMEGNGTVIVSAGQSRIEATAGLPAGGDFVSISISDHGCGITPETQARMYEPFFSSKSEQGAAGLGLTTASIFAQQNGGWLQCKSQLGEGTTFNLFLPAVTEPNAVEDEEVPKVTVPLGRNETVLVVDDEPLIGELEALFLRNLGYRVTIAANSEEAERALKASGGVDLVVADLNMPRIGGLELIERARRARLARKFILASGLPMEDTASNPDGLPILQKPFELKELAEQVRRTLDG